MRGKKYFIQAILTQWPPQAGPRGQKHGWETTTAQRTGFITRQTHSQNLHAWRYWFSTCAFDNGDQLVA